MKNAAKKYQPAFTVIRSNIFGTDYKDYETLVKTAEELGLDNFTEDDKKELGLVPVSNPKTSEPKKVTIPDDIKKLIAKKVGQNKNFNQKLEKGKIVELDLSSFGNIQEPIQFIIGQVCPPKTEVHVGNVCMGFLCSPYTSYEWIGEHILKGDKIPDGEILVLNWAIVGVPEDFIKKYGKVVGEASDEEYKEMISELHAKLYFNFDFNQSDPPVEIIAFQTIYAEVKERLAQYCDFAVDTPDMVMIDYDDEKMFTP